MKIGSESNTKITIFRIRSKSHAENSQRAMQRACANFHSFVFTEAWMIERDYYEASLCTETKPKNAPKANPRTKNEHKTRITYKKKKNYKKKFFTHIFPKNDRRFNFLFRYVKSAGKCAVLKRCCGTEAACMAVGNWLWAAFCVGHAWADPQPNRELLHQNGNIHVHICIYI